MKRLFLLLGLFLAGVFAVRTGVGQGIAGNSFITSPLMGSGVVAPTLSPAPIIAAPTPVYTPTPIYPGPVRIHVVPPLPGESSHAPVAVTVGPTVHPDNGLNHLLQPSFSTSKPLQPTIGQEHGLRGWLHRHHWLR